MPKKFILILFFLSLIFGIFTYRVFNLAYTNHDNYIKKYIALTDIYINGNSAPRGRIIDINGKVIVDNIGVNTIIYHKPSNISRLEEFKIAERLVELTDYSYQYDEGKLKEFYLEKFDGNELITDEEWDLLDARKIDKAEIKRLKLSRITEDDINKLSNLEKYSSYFYYLMNDSYFYDNKIILDNVDDLLYARILEDDLPGIFGEISWKRKYNYGDSLKSILGAISNNLPKEKEYLLNEGYTYSDKVGISGLEEYYEEYLKGEKAIYKLNNNNLELVRAPKCGKDLILEIDIDIQVKIENIIKEQIEAARGMVNTEFYRESYALISEPLTGKIRAIAGIRRLDNGEYQDVSINTIKNAYTVGSAVKAASISVGYQTGVIDINTSYYDSCVKLANLPEKCSYQKLGRINDVRALALSSNYYQFMIALGVSGNKYVYNMQARVSEDDFATYRNTFKSFGLGDVTGIDLPGEGSGLIGDKVAIDLLLNLAIGQYDLYTPVELLQYINTIANNGERLKLNLMHSINDKDRIILENKVQVLNKVSLEDKYMKRIQEGLTEVMTSGTGYYYIKPGVMAAGKTGTSESYIDSNYDGVLDSYVLSNTFLMYTLADNKYSMVVISPNTSNLNGKSKYRAPINRLIARNINDFLLLGS